MNKLTRIRLNLAKNVFHLVGFDVRGKEIKKKMLRRAQLATVALANKMTRTGRAILANNTVYRTA